jgi:hypothetical protein
MMNFLKALPILLILFGTPLILIFGFGVRWYRSYQNKKYLKENAKELEELERQYNEIVWKAKK